MSPRVPVATDFVSYSLDANNIIAVTGSVHGRSALAEHVGYQTAALSEPFGLLVHTSEFQVGFFMSMARDSSVRATSPASTKVQARHAPENLRTMKAL